MWPSITNNSVFRYHIRLIIFIHTAVKSAMQAFRALTNPFHERPT